MKKIITLCICMFFAMMTTQAFCHTDTGTLTETQAAYAGTALSHDNAPAFIGELEFLPIDRDWDDDWDDRWDD